MFRMNLSEAKNRFPNLRVAAQEAIEKSDETFRIVHDATHGVQINPEIKVLDQVELPGPAELARIVQLMQSDQMSPVFAIAADV